MTDKQKEELIFFVKGFDRKITYKEAVNGLVFYVPDRTSLVSLLCDLGVMGAYFQTARLYGGLGRKRQPEYSVTVIDFDQNWQEHNQDYL